MAPTAAQYPPAPGPAAQILLITEASIPAQVVAVRVAVSSKGRRGSRGLWD